MSSLSPPYQPPITAPITSKVDGRALGVRALPASTPPHTENLQQTEGASESEGKAKVRGKMMLPFKCALKVFDIAAQARQLHCMTQEHYK